MSSVISSPLIKICGVRTSEVAIECARAGADFLGFVFVPKSPRYLTAEDAEAIVADVKEACDDEGVATPRFVGLFVDAGEKQLAETAPFISHFQFHGHEDAERLADLRAEFGVEVIKAVGVAEAADLANLSALAEAADYLLFDANPPKGADRAGGLGAAFDWSHLGAYTETTPFLLAGGLTPDNAAAAVAAGAAFPAFAGVDVSSGVERAPGVKDIARIRSFVAAARTIARATY